MIHKYQYILHIQIKSGKSSLTLIVRSCVASSILRLFACELQIKDTPFKFNPFCKLSNPPNYYILELIFKDPCFAKGNNIFFKY